MSRINKLKLTHYQRPLDSGGDVMGRLTADAQGEDSSRHSIRVSSTG